MKPPRRAFRLAYTTNPPREDPKLFRCRDGVAFLELNGCLAAQGYAYEESVILFPNGRRTLTDGYPKFRATDLLSLTTRPPLDDEGKVGPRKQILRINGPLKRVILDVVCGKYFAYCNRRFVQLPERAQALLKTDVRPERWRNVEFFENHQTGEKISCGARTAVRCHWAALVKKHQVSPDQQEAPAPGHTSTVVFLILDVLPSLGCDVLVRFGMDGDCTLVWNHLVRSLHPTWSARRVLSWLSCYSCGRRAATRSRRLQSPPSPI